MRRNDGLTLLEMLVVLVLTAMLAGLIVQGLGFFLGKYDAVRRIQAKSLENGLHQRWFISSVRNLVPLASIDRAFQGDGSQFSGISLAPLAGPSGRPSQISWAFVDSEAGTRELRYSEGTQIRWQILDARVETMRFEYADTSGSWHDRWPIASRRIERIPRMIRMVQEDGRTVWSAALALHPEPVPNFLEDT